MILRRTTIQTNLEDSGPLTRWPNVSQSILMSFVFICQHINFDEFFFYIPTNDYLYAKFHWLRSFHRFIVALVILKIGTNAQMFYFLLNPILLHIFLNSFFLPLVSTQILSSSRTIFSGIRVAQTLSTVTEYL